MQTVAVHPEASTVDRKAPRLTDFVDMATLQEIQDSFTAVTQLAAVIRDADGEPLTDPTDTDSRAESDEVLDWLITDHDGDNGTDNPGVMMFNAPIMVDGRQLGSISIERHESPPSSPAIQKHLRQLAEHLNLPPAQLDQLIAATRRSCGPSKAAGVQFLYLLANSIARLCFQEYQLRQRFNELTVLYDLSNRLADQRDLQATLDTAAKSAAQMMGVKAASIRLLDDAHDMLVPRATHGLSPSYISKGSLPLRKSQIYQQALKGKVVYVEDLTADPRVLHPEYAKREKLVSMLAAGMIYHDQPIGLVQLFTSKKRAFNHFEVNLLSAMARLLSTAIENARLDAEHLENQRMARQLQLAADVQKRMLPREVPSLPGFDIAARYVPCFELGGDFYDFLDLNGNLGVGVGDVVGKGIAASLLVASVRSALRAYAQDLYDLDEIIARVNVALSRDTLDNEFATIFYGVLDPQNKRLTYCNAGHDPPLLLRKGRLTSLDTGGMIVGVDSGQHYEKAMLDLQPGDVLLIYTDGLIDARNFRGQSFGRKRLSAALKRMDPAMPAQTILAQILWEMRRFAGLNQRIDDTTLVVIKAV